MINGRSFRVDEWTVEPELNQLRGPSGVRKLRPQIMELLVYLAGRQGQVVSTDEILEKVWAGKIVTSGSIYNSVAELRQALTDGDDSAKFIETIPKRGYRLIADVSVEGNEAPRTEAPREKSRFGFASLFVVMAAVAALLLWVAYPDRAPEQSSGAIENPELAEIPRPERSIAVLPFNDMTPDGDLAWFSDGVTEEILNSLARLPEFKVAARTSSFLVRDKGLSVSEIGATLNVRFLVEGSVRRNGDDMRVTYQLIRVDDGFHVVSDTIDLEFHNILEVQRRVAVTIAEALDVVLDENSRQAMFITGTRDVEAYEFYLRGKELLYDWFATGNNDSIWRATEWFGRAIEEDPRFGFAYGLRAHTYMRYLEAAIPAPARPGQDTAPIDHEQALEQLLADQSRAAAFAPTPAIRTVFEISLVVFSDDYRSLPQLADRFDSRVAEELADGFDVYHVLAALLLAGRTEAALDFTERRIRRNPLDGLGYNQAWSAAMVAGHRERALGYLERAIAEAEDVKFTEHNLVLSQLIEQDWAAATELAERPGWGIDVLREPILAFIYAATGRRAEAERIVGKLLEAGHSGPYLALALRELGRRDEARELVVRIDESPAGNLVSLYLFAELGGRYPFNPEWTPNFSARLEEAGITLDKFVVDAGGEERKDE